MVFDYLGIELPESKKTELNTMGIQRKMERILFSLALFPDMQLAEAFGGVGNIRNFLPYHLGDEIYAQIREDIIARRSTMGEQPLINILQNLYDLWSEEYDINDLYGMITGKCNHEKPIEDFNSVDLSIYREEDLEASEYLNFANVIESMDMHIELEKRYHNPEVASGYWWVIAYDRLVLDGKVRPFLLMARLNDEGKICYIQGCWPLDYFHTAIAKMFPIGYRSKHGDYKFIEIRVEAIESRDGRKLQKYHLIREVTFPFGKSEDGT